MAMNKDEKAELTQILRHAHDTIVTLRRRVEALQPKAEAFDTIQTLAQQMNRDTGGAAEIDVGWRIKQYLESLDKPTDQTQ